MGEAMPRIVSNIVDVYPFRRVDGRVEFLMLRRRPEARLGGTWQAVHGKIETGESAVQAGLRELSEETGLRPLRLWQLEHVSAFFVADLDRILMCPGLAVEVSPADAVTLNHEHAEYRWEPADSARTTFIWPGQREAIAEILDVILAGAPAEPHLRIELT